MKTRYIGSFLRIALAALLLPAGVQAGNPDRAGQAGASELLINPWARSNGWGGANSGSIRGLEAQFMNVAGTAFTKKTEALFSHSIYLQGSGMALNAFGITQKAGEAGVLGLSVVSFDFGDIPVTTTEQPEGNIGNYRPQYINIGLSYAKVFSNSIYGGFNLKIINENIANVSARGIAVDAGIQYVTGTNEDRDNIKFGIALKNVGTPMKFGGDGLSVRLTAPSGAYQYTVQQRTQGFEIPSLLNIGGSYDFDVAVDHRLTAAANFTSNSFTRDEISVGLEYAFREMFMLRGGFVYEDGITSNDDRTTVYTGPCAGVSVDVPMGKSGKRFGIDYAFRATNPFNGVHTFGLRFTL